MGRFLRIAFLSGVLLAACNRAPDDLREWRPDDHKHQSESKPTSDDDSPQVTGSAEAPLPGLEEVTIAAYRRSCAACHGQLGRGDGPQGPMVKARDLSDSAWQSSVTDAQIAETIAKGKGRMPPSGLPDATVQGLVHLVRLFDRSRLAAAQASAQAAAASASPGSSAAPAQSAAPTGNPGHTGNPGNPGQSVSAGRSAPPSK